MYMHVHVHAHAYACKLCKQQATPVTAIPHHILTRPMRKLSLPYQEEGSKHTRKERIKAYEKKKGSLPLLIHIVSYINKASFLLFTQKMVTSTGITITSARIQHSLSTTLNAPH